MSREKYKFIPKQEETSWGQPYNAGYWRRKWRPRAEEVQDAAQWLSEVGKGLGNFLRSFNRDKQ